MSYEVVNVEHNSEEKTLVAVKTIGCNMGKPEKAMTEEGLYQCCCNFRDLKDEKVDIRRNLVVISRPSDIGNDTVVKALFKAFSNFNKTVSITTRSKRDNETEGVCV